MPTKTLIFNQFNKIRRLCVSSVGKIKKKYKNVPYFNLPATYL